METRPTTSPEPDPQDDSPAEPTSLDQRLAGPMFALTVLFLVLTAGALHFGGEAIPAAPLKADPNANGELPATESRVLGESPTIALGIWCAWFLLPFYPLYLVETLSHWRSGAPRLRQHLWYCLLPPLRLGARDHASGRWIWLPGAGWSVVDDALRRKVERNAHAPMMIVALLVLPLLVAQHYLSKHMQGSLWLTGAVEAGAAVIWMAFTFEFIVMLAIAEKRWDYTRRHWLDLLIICFPLIAFLRFVRTWSLVRMLRLGRMQQAAKVFRLRGTAMRLWRAVLLLELIDRWFRRPEQRLQTLQHRLALREREVAELRSEIAELEARLPESSPS